MHVHAKRFKTDSPSSNSMTSRRPIDLKRSASSPSGRPLEQLVKWLLFGAALVSVLTTFGIVFTLVKEMSGFFSEVRITEFLFGTEWFPLMEPQRFGILPLVSGSLMVAIGACLVAVPVGLAAALFLSEYCSRHIRVVLKSFLEILAGIPTVVYGYLAVTFITPLLRRYIESVEVFNALSAAIVVGVMIIPTISSVTQDAFEAVPRYLREAAYGLGARRHQVALGVVFPAAFSGFVAAVILAFSRAIGETMAVTLAAGATPNLSFNFYESIQTMTAYIVQVSKGDTPAGTVEYQTIFAVGLVLFVMTLSTNLVALFFVRRIQEKY